MKDVVGATASDVEVSTGTNACTMDTMSAESDEEGAEVAGNAGVASRSGGELSEAGSEVMTT